MKNIVISLGLFLIAGICEIAGGYLIWQWLRENKNIGFAFLGAVILILYGVIPTFQQAHFSRVYAAYGGIFVVMSLIWGCLVDRVYPDRFDLIGAALAIMGVCIIMYSPRTTL